MPPTSHPRSFPFPPAIKPPMNTAKNERPSINHLIESSVKPVNLSSNEKSKLVASAATKMLDNP